MIKVLRILGLYVCLWFVFFLVGIPFSTQSFDVYLVSVFFWPSRFNLDQRKTHQQKN